MVSRISVQQADLALELGLVSSSSKLRDLAGVLRVVGDAGETALPRHAVVALRVPVGALQVGDEVRVDVRHVGVVELLQPAEVDHPGGHPVGEHDDVAADRLAVAELVLDLGEELVVVVDVGVVGDVDAGLLLERLERGSSACLLTSMYSGQLREDELLLRVRLVRALARLGGLPVPLGAAGGEQRGQAEAEARRRPRPEKARRPRSGSAKPADRRGDRGRASVATVSSRSGILGAGVPA